MQKNCKKNAKFLIEILKWLTKIMLRLVKKEAPENWFSRFYVIFDKEDKNPIFRGSISFRCAKNQISKRNFQENDVNDLTLTLSGIEIWNDVSLIFNIVSFPRFLLPSVIDWILS